jgi:hypothetical protein
MASTFENGQSLAVVRAILNGNADDITQLQLKIGGSNVLPIANGGTGTSVDAEYETRSAMVDNIAELLSIANGSVISAGSQLYQKVNSSTVISDLPNFIPFGQPTMAHWGVPIDGTTDATTKVREAVASGYPIILAQSGYYRLTNQVILEDCQIVGEGYDFTSMKVSTFNDISGTVFLCDFTPSTAESLFHLKRAGQLSNCLAYFIGQQAVRPTNWIPVTTPWAVTTGSYTDTARTVRQERSGITDFCFLEFTYGIKCRTGGEQGNFERVKGNPFTIGLDVDANYSVTIFRDFHFWPFGGYSTADWQLNERIWTLNNLTAYRFGRVDGLLMDGCFTIGAAVAIEFYPSTSGNILNGTATTNFHVTDCYLDGCNTSVKISGTYAAGWYPSGSFMACTMQHWDSADNEIVTEYPNIVISSQIKIVQFVGCFLTAGGGDRNGSYVTLNAPGGVANFSACSVNAWDLAATGAAAFVQTGANSQIVLNDMRYFAANNTIVYPSYGLVSGKAIASGNVLSGSQITGSTSYQFSTDGPTTTDYITASDTTNPTVRFRRSRGTLAAKTTTNTGDFLGVIDAFGWQGDRYSQTAIVRFLAGSAGAGAPITGNMQVLLQNSTTGGGADAFVQALTMTPTVISIPNTSTSLGLGTSTPQRVLHVKNPTPIIRIEDTDTAVSTIYAEVQSGLTGELQLISDPGNASVSASSVQFLVDGAERGRFSNTGTFVIGTTGGAERSLSISKDITGSSTAYSTVQIGAIQTDVTATAYMNRTIPTVVASHPGLSNIYHYAAAQGTIGAGSTVTSQIGFLVESNLIGATTNVGFSVNGVAAASVTTGKFVYGINLNQATATGGGTAYNIYAQGTAPNYLAGVTSIGGFPSAGDTLRVNKAITGATSSHGIRNDGAIQSDVTATAFVTRTIPSVVDAAFTLSSLYHYSAAQGTIGASATVSTQVGYLVEGSLIGAAANVGFQANGVAAASVTTGKTVRAILTSQATASGGGTAHNLYISGTAPSYFQGNVGLGTASPITPLHVVGATVTTGVVYKNQPAQTSKAAATTLTIAELLTGIVQYTGALATLTLPTGTLIEGGVPATFPVDMSFDVSFINTGSGIATLGTATGLTLVGSMDVASTASGLFRFRKTAANTYTVYRIS